MDFPKEVYCFVEKPNPDNVEEDFLMVSPDIQGLACENSKVPCGIYRLVGVGHVVTTRTVKLARKTGGKASNFVQQRHAVRSRKSRKAATSA